MKSSAAVSELLIEPRQGFDWLDHRELWRYRELLGFLIWRDIKVRYKQTLLGGLWALLQPLIGMAVFGVVFTRVATINTGNVPYLLFVFLGLVPWTFFANSITMASNSLVGSEQMVRKIYFPRILVPVAAILALGLDVLVSLGFAAIMLLIYHRPVGPELLSLPLFLAGAMMASVGLGLFLGAANVLYRDVKYIVPFFTQMALFVTPVIYPLSRIPARYQGLLALNPMSGMVEGFRHSVLGTPFSWPLAAISFGSAALVLAIGLTFFGRVQRSFADVI